MMGLKILLQLLGVLCLAATSNQSCGKRKLAVPPGASRIIGGRDAPEGAWPWQASIQFLGTHFCGGTIISNKWVVSAAHCYHNYIWHSSFLTVLVGITALSKPGPHSQRRGVKNVIIHERYDFNSSNNDVALLMLKSPLKFTNYIQPCCIPMSINHQVALNLSNCFITGWGSINYKGGAVDMLQEAELELIETLRCNQKHWYNGLITENMLCAGMLTGGVDTCQGDSGSPLQCYSEKDDQYYLIGVTSFGESCGHPHRPGVYSKTSAFGKWLAENQLKDRASSHRLFSSLILVRIFAALMLF
ncbi:acrosin [Poecilia reticulata]|uniref:acrosin n=1 Tax=Poecilia reticulata TaxID=8081 RepID=UPI0004A221EC|nr:PREDICTED: acrosin-like [Poecilia reticulata]